MAPQRVAAVDLKIVLRLSTALLLMNAALIQGRRSLVFYSHMRRLIGGGALLGEALFRVNTVSELITSPQNMSYFKGFMALSDLSV